MAPVVTNGSTITLKTLKDGEPEDTLFAVSFDTDLEKEKGEVPMLDPENPVLYLLMGGARRDPPPFQVSFDPVPVNYTPAPQP